MERNNNQHLYHQMDWKGFHHIMWKYAVVFVVIISFLHNGHMVCARSFPKPRFIFQAAPLRNEIRPSNCTVKKTGEVGTCMFAQKCIAAKGVHLDTCIDRFFMGSCCRLPKPTVPNHISNEISYVSSSSSTWTPSSTTTTTTTSTTTTTTTTRRPETETFISVVTSSSVQLASTPTQTPETPVPTSNAPSTSFQTLTPIPTSTTQTTTAPTTASTTPSTTPTAPSTPSTMTFTSTAPTEMTSTTATSTTFNPDKLSEMDYKEACGRQIVKERPSARIVNGHKAEFGEWPWQISLRQWKRTTFMHKCGAALLGENWAITAAHCIDGVPVEDLLLRIGEYDLSNERESSRHVERRVQIMATHPNFNSRTFENDLAMLRLYEPVTFRQNIIPICLPPDNTTFVNRTGYVTGWGRLYVDGPLPNILQEVAVPIITNSDCEQQYRKAGFLESIPEIFLCAGYDVGGRDSCEGDSGGPLVVKDDDDRWVLAGVISWGIGCAEPHQPGVYTRISKFKDWIEDILRF